MRLQYLAFAFSIILFSCQSSEKSEEDIIWTSLFNGENLEDWHIKIRGYELNDNFGETFRVNNGLLQVRYDAYDAFQRRYGHIFFKKPFSYYLLKVEYRFVGDQAPEGENWAYRNSGAMLHSQDPSTILTDQDFPISIEAQFLGGNGSDERSTCNLCTPGTHVVMADTLFTPHCINSTSKTYHGDQWVQAYLIVLGDEEIHHLVEKDTVISYYKPQIGGGIVSPLDSLIKLDGTPLKAGYIALQSESHPIDFRKIELIDLADYQNDRTKIKELVTKALR
ncbi:MAG TPA: DUF1080 domain-containing protein [Algoriphagus sp.]|jgi:hypothetical protein|uniref:3-keto-disaccharide hydrolase n=1 Tax=Algoriphagus TaxID=246875 RepID=UPI000C5B4008|nr:MULTISPECIES: DUF1080 domain-containing protein [Algoriphagus]MAL13599.1 hypothetical protein [Algoriphagus sp.]MAN86224.1 hypothetical protein [Algoriphagus sp.]HAD51379.1 DUF1080 domain-containing protein [Algoriphagus sp.]HAH38541.1 DUF1080 domain-containing protein [Algoriphagus sp.]HAS60773.1 DUF1080 domain-containing protein [Algoriphagus sp.]|tara:strand:+ start:226 stop:1062 length:837 start_codon:yes stop_codon:yes gene_type:complete